MPLALSDTDEWVAAPDGPSTAEPRTSTLIRSYMGKINNRTRWLFNRFSAGFLGSFTTFVAGAVDTGTNTINLPSHGIAANTLVRCGNVGGTMFAGTGILAPSIAGLSISPLYVLVSDANNIQLSLTSGGAAIDLTAAGSGTHFLFTVPTSPLDLIVHPAFTNLNGDSIPAGSLRVTLAAYFASLAGGTFTGDVVFNAPVEANDDLDVAGVTTHTNKIVHSGANAYVARRTFSLNNAATQTISGAAGDFFYCPDVSQNSVYTVSDPAEAGISFVVSRRNVGGGFAAAFHRVGAVLMGTLPNSGASWIRFMSHAEDGALTWHAEEWGGAAANLD